MVGMADIVEQTPPTVLINSTKKYPNFVLQLNGTLEFQENEQKLRNDTLICKSAGDNVH